MQSSAEYEAEWKWMQSSEAAKLSAAAKAKALLSFKQRFPNADMQNFEVQVNFDKNRKATWEVLYKKEGDSSQCVFGSERKYWPKAMISALGLHHDGGFPFQLINPKQTYSKTNLSDRFSRNDRPNIAGWRTSKQEAKDLRTPTDYFTMQFRQIFKDTQITFRTAKYARRWRGGSNMGFWPQQLNFALWCATTGCEISCEFLLDDSDSMNLTPQLRSFYRFYVYFTTRCISHAMGGIRAAKALCQTTQRLLIKITPMKSSRTVFCAEFGVSPSSDFRYTHTHTHTRQKPWFGQCVYWYAWARHPAYRL